MAHEIVLRPEIKIRAYCKDGNCCVEVTIPTQYGDLRLCGSYPMAKAYAKVKAWLAAKGAPPGSTESGGLLSKLKNITRKVAQAAALAPAIAAVKKIQQNPILARAVGLTTAVIPGAGSARVAINAAANMIQKAQRGNLASLADLRRLRSLAQMGLPQAMEAWKTTRGVFSAIKAKQPTDFFRGLAAPFVQQIQQGTALASQAVQMKDQILNALPPHLRPFANAAIAQIPGAGVVQQAAQLAPMVSSISAGAMPLFHMMDPQAYAAGSYGC